MHTQWPSLTLTHSHCWQWHPKHRQKKEINLTSSKFKTFGHHRIVSSEWKVDSCNRNSFLQIIYLIKIMYLEYMKNAYNSTRTKQTAWMNNGQKISVDVSPKKIHKSLISTWKCSLSLIVRKQKSKPQWNTTSDPLKWLFWNRQNALAEYKVYVCYESHVCVVSKFVFWSFNPAVWLCW